MINDKKEKVLKEVKLIE